MALKRRRDTSVDASTPNIQAYTGRSLLRYEQSDSEGAEQAHSSPQELSSKGKSSGFVPATNNNDANDGWQTVGHKDKRRKTDTEESNKLEQEKALKPLIYHSPSARIDAAVKIDGLQQLVLYLLTGHQAPRWIAVKNSRGIKRVVVLLVPGLESAMFNGQISLLHDSDPQESSPAVETKNANASHSTKSSYVSPDDYYPIPIAKETLPLPLKPFADMFSHIWSIKAPTDDKLTRLYSPMFAMLQAPYPKTGAEKRTKGPMLSTAAWTHFENKRTPITSFLAEMEELLLNGYVLHPALCDTADARAKLLERRQQDHTTSESGWVDTRVSRLEDAEPPADEIQSGSILVGRQVFAIDCEFCKTIDGESALARISMVDWTGATLIDELVKPDKPIEDYVTEYSGITKEQLDPVTTTLADVQKRLLEMITPRTILLGHSLESDLKALKLTHPFIIDTALIFPHPHGAGSKHGLRMLAKRYLRRDIQNHGNKGHDSIEDAVAVLDLVKQKCERGPLWGSAEGNRESIFKRLKRTPREKSDGNGSTDSGAPQFKVGAMVDWGSPSFGAGASADVLIGCESDAEVVEGIKRAVTGEHPDAPVVDFVFGRLRELEAIRGWWTASKTHSTLDTLRESVFARYSVPDPDEDASAPNSTVLAQAVIRTAKNIKEIYSALPEGTAFIVYTGHGDPREVNRLAALELQFRNEYIKTSWNQLTVRWTDREVQARRDAVKRAREGIGFVSVK